MPRMWSREWMESLKEDDLRVKVLIPLFRAMRYTEIRDFQGVNELGKDLVLRKESDFGDTEYTAVVAKAVPITGKAKGVLAEINTQVNQALDSQIWTTTDGKSRTIGKAIVLTSQRMKEDAVSRLHETLSRVRSRYTLVHGDKLWELVTQYLPQALILGRLEEVRQTLGEGDSEHQYRIAVAEDSIHLEAHPLGNVAVQPKISVVDSEGPEVEEARRLLREREETGRSVELKQSLLQFEGLPPLVHDLLAAETGGTVHLMPQQGRTPLIVTFGVRDAEGNEHIGLPYVELYVEQAGSKEITFSNAQQPIAITTRLTLQLADGKITTNFAPEDAGANVSEHLKIANFLTSEGTGFVRMYKTGTELLWTEFPGQMFVEGYPKAYRALLALVVEIQEATKTDIAIPDRDFFTDQDIENLGTAISIIRKGEFLININTQVRVGFIREILAKDATGTLKPFSFGNAIRIPILGTLVDFGQFKVTQRAARIAPGIWKSLPQAIEDKDDDDWMPVELVPTRKKQFRCVVPEWKKKVRER